MHLGQQCIKVGRDGLDLIQYLIHLLDPLSRAAFLEARLFLQTPGQLLGFITQPAGKVAPGRVLRFQAAFMKDEAI